MRDAAESCCWLGLRRPFDLDEDFDDALDDVRLALFYVDIPHYYMQPSHAYSQTTPIGADHYFWGILTSKCSRLTIAITGAAVIARLRLYIRYKTSCKQSEQNLVCLLVPYLCRHSGGTLVANEINKKLSNKFVGDKKAVWGLRAWTQWSQPSETLAMPLTRVYSHSSVVSKHSRADPFQQL